MHLTRWGKVTHICVSKITIIGPDNGLSPIWRQAIIWTNTGILSIQWTLGTNFIAMLIEILSYIFIQENAFEYIVWKGRPSCLGLHVLNCHLEIGGHLSRPQCDNYHTPLIYMYVTFSTPWSKGNPGVGLPPVCVQSLFFVNNASAYTEQSPCSLLFHLNSLRPGDMVPS